MLDWGWWSSHCLDHSSRGPGGFFTHWKLNVMPPTIHWPELTTRPRPARKCYPSLCPESRKRGIVGENITPTVCPSNHQNVVHSPSCKQNILILPSKGDDPNSPWFKGLSSKSRISGWYVRTPTARLDVNQRPRHTQNAAHSTHPCHKTLRWHSQLHGASSVRALILRDMLPNLIFSMVFRSILGDHSFSTVLLGETQRSNSLSLFPL